MFLNIPLMLNINEKAFCALSGEHPHGSDDLPMFVHLDSNPGKAKEVQ